MSAITSPAFRRLVQSLKRHKKTLTVAEQCCGGLIQASIMAQPGASSVFVGGSLPYNTLKAKALLLNDEELHQSLSKGSSSSPQHDKNISTTSKYQKRKFEWTSRVATAFCAELETDYALVEGGAAGPTFGPSDMTAGFAVLAVAGRDSCGTTAIRKQRLVESPNNDREANMRRFADAAAELLTTVLDEDTATAKTTTTATATATATISTEEPGTTTTSTTQQTTAIRLDRATALRTDSKKLQDLKPTAKYVVAKGPNMLFRSPTELAILNYESLTLKYDPESCTTTFLGMLTDDDGGCTPLFSIDVVDESTGEDTEFDLENHKTGKPYFYANVRTNAPLLNVLENEIALYTMAFSNWQRSSKYCASCGSPLELTHGGTAQVCTGCKANNNNNNNSLSWPRQDPSIIVSIASRCSQKLLLARSHRHPPKMHTVLAGFVEAGESLEHAVAREVLEEVGIRVDEDSIQYLASQPWPFPRSTMVAFSATADANQPLRIDETELVDAAWFPRDEVYRASLVEGPVMDPNVAETVLATNPKLNLLIPPKQVVARKLIDHWLKQQ